MTGRLVIRGARYPGDIAVEDGWITAVGTAEPEAGDEVLDCPGDIVTAGFINTHHHLYQWMTRGRATGCNLFDWLVHLYPVWGRLSVDDVRAAARTVSDLQTPTEELSTVGNSPSSTREPVTTAKILGQMTSGRHPLRGIRRVVAQNMAQSWSDIPHIHSLDEVDATLLIDLRTRIRSMDRSGASAVTPLTLAAAATARALRRYPMVNGCIEGDPADTVVIHSSVSLGIAAATTRGLVVPVVRDADRLDLFTLATKIADVVNQARDGSLTAADLTGGTFTITNYGALGGRWALPIIPPGQAGILGLGSIAERPLAIDGRVEARPTLPLVLGVDHRLVDGDLAEAFKRSVMDDLAEPLNLLVGS